MSKKGKLIKVCGMRDSANIQALSALDVDIMGMIFYEKSPRYVTNPPEVDLPETMDKAGVFVNAGFDEIMDKASTFALDIIQLHGRETPELCARLKNRGLTVFKAFGIDENFDFNRTKEYEDSVSLFVFDTKTKGYGGSGKKYNWKKLNEYQGETGFLLSGGITPDDLTAILSFRHPQFAGIDLNSGFEIEPGIKDIQRLERFIKSFRETTAIF